MDRDENEVRIISLGGSVTYGAGILDKAKAYPGVMEKMLNDKDPSHKWVVMNAGVPGYCSLQGRLALEELIVHKPDIVTVCFGVNEYNRSGFRSTLVEYWDRTHGRENPISATQKVMRKSALYRFLKGLLYIRGNTDFEKGSGLVSPNTRPDEYYRILKEIDDLCQKEGIKTIFLNEAHLQQIFGHQEVDDYQAAMARVAKERGIPLVDLTALLKEYFEDDMLLDSVHPTMLGHSRISKDLTDIILKQMGASSK